ncbi:MAG TPA: WecB/TagA/CpsF family glycosyltransferase [Bryobacteraceae bacterium]|nr:WecB/TagA/CpsF family glycosyltransferase [Bryobacteraceae bacterium]
MDVIDYAQAIRKILEWAHQRYSGFVCAANVHVVMEGFDSSGYQEMINSADMVTPDGMPLVWMLRLRGSQASRVYGPDLMRLLLAACEEEGVSIGLYGASPRVLDRLIAAIQKQHPRLSIAYACAPPFRELTAEEDARIVTDIQDSGAQVLFVGMGCPKQERWITQHQGAVPAPMLGVGAAFDFIAGAKRYAPAWLQRLGLEWLFRLLTEPRRLWRRYAVHNPRFVVFAALELFGAKNSNF